MTVAEVARTYALTLTPVIALASGRLFTLRFPQSPTLPAVLFQQIGDIQFGHLRGTARLKWARIQVDCLAATIKSARDLDAAVMGDYVGGATTGLLGVTADVGGSPSIRMIVGSESIGYREEYLGDELRQARTMRDYKVWVESI